MISNGCVLPNIILKNLYYSEFWFLVSFWLNFNFFIFLQLQQILSILNQDVPGTSLGRPRDVPGSSVKARFLQKVGRPRDVPGTSQGRPWLKFHRIFQVGKKSFFLKNIFFFVFYGCLSFFNGKYRYFATFDQQILAEKLVFRILQHRFSRGSAISKMIVVAFRVTNTIN